MYQIIGVQRNKQQRLLETPDSAKAALAVYARNAKDYGSIIVVAPDGERIDVEELTRRAAQE
jgi:hypothetical protein